MNVVEIILVPLHPILQNFDNSWFFLSFYKLSQKLDLLLQNDITNFTLADI